MNDEYSVISFTVHLDLMSISRVCGTGVIRGSFSWSSKIAALGIMKEKV